AQCPRAWFLLIILVSHCPTVGVKSLLLVAQIGTKQNAEKLRCFDVVGPPIATILKHIASLARLIGGSHVVPLPKLGIKSLDTGEVFIITPLKHCQVHPAELFGP